MSTNLIPGVYTSYEVSGNVYGGRHGAAVGLAANAEAGEVGKVVALTGYAQAYEVFGGGNLAKLAEVLFKNGAPKVYAVRVDGVAYTPGFEALMEHTDIKFVVSDSQAGAVHAMMNEVIMAGDERSKYRIGFAETSYTEIGNIVVAAAILNSERVIMVSHCETEGTPGAVAAALCGAAASEDDPAMPLNGAVLQGLGAIGGNFSDADVNALIAAGVTPIETVSGNKTVIRGVTTKTTTDEVEDLTWREMNTVMIVDEVLPAIRDGLKLKFSRAKNTEQTRGAIRTQVLVGLENYRKREIIDSYGEINVSQSEDDPTVCLVSFAFTVAHGLNKIELKAHITV